MATILAPTAQNRQQDAGATLRNANLFFGLAKEVHFRRPSFKTRVISGKREV
jgi:hypothetical protein